MPSLIDQTYVTDRMALTPAQAAALPGYLAAASRAVESYCHRTFSATDFDEWYDSGDAGRLFLRNRPVISIASIATGRTSPTTLDPARYTFNPATAEVRGVGCGDGFYSPFWGGWEFGPGVLGGYGFQDVRVVYRAGYEPADMPADVQMATFEVARGMILGAARNPLVQSETLGPHSKTYASGAFGVGSIAGSGAAELLTNWVIYRLA